MVIAKAVNPNAADPMTLYAAAKHGYVADRISFKAAGAGQVRAGDQNPYTLYSKVVGLTTTHRHRHADDRSGRGGARRARARASTIWCAAELNSLMGNSALCSADKLRLKQHFDSIRDIEITMGTMGATCTKTGLSTRQLDALKSGIAFKTDGMIENVVKLHMEVVALAFACNYNRVATLQWGDGTDGTKYSVPSNAGLGWTFHQLSHRVQSDSARPATIATAERRTRRSTGLRMQTLLYGLDAVQGARPAGQRDGRVDDATSPTARATAGATFRTSSGATAAVTSSRGNTSTPVQRHQQQAATTRSSRRRSATRAPPTVNFGAGTGTGELTAIKV